MNIIEENEVDIHSVPLSSFDTGMDGEEDVDDCEEIGEEVLDPSQPPLQKSHSIISRLKIRF